MNVGMLTLTGFMMMGAVLTATVPLRATSQSSVAQQNTPKIEPQQNDRRTAIAGVNPQRPIQIRVVSQTTLPVVASLGTAAGDRPVAPGKSVTFGRLHTSYLPLPLDLQVTLQDTPDPNQPVGVFLDIKTAGNEIIVGVKTAASSDGNSSQTVSVDQKGAIYRF
ncbi:MAG: hypothetical protein NW220_01200 [Leptolyngbyaceae cyanobacterium bins.349]|nr:hypothetical protein [Leptolyngbyaceae cyanobacterium bins.349]